MSVNHVGIILDGNRRFAKRLMKQPWKGHEWGAEKVKKLLFWAEELGIKELTLYAFSMQNFNRPKQEFDYLMRIFNSMFEELFSEERLKEINDKGLRINVIGRIHLFPEDVYEKMLKIMELTKNNDSYVINFAMAYGGREELVDAMKNIGRRLEAGNISSEDVDEKLISENLYLSDEPDLIIRTGGDQRTSNFLAWQSIYSEWIFLEKTWPEFDKEDLINCINDFENRGKRTIREIILLS